MTFRRLALAMLYAVGTIWLAAAPVARADDETPAQPEKSKEAKPKGPAPNVIVLKGTLTGLQPQGTHTLTLQEGRSYSVSTDSPGFFTQVLIEDGSGSKLLDWTAGSTFKAPGEGPLRLLVNSPGGSTGQYVVTVQPVDLTPTPPGEILSVGPDGLNVEAVLTKDDPLDKARKKPCKVYEVNMEEGQTYVIDLMSKQFDAYLRLEDAGGKQLAVDDDSGGNNNARIRFHAPKAGVYRVIATTFNQRTGLYQLKIKQAEK